MAVRIYIPMGAKTNDDNIDEVISANDTHRWHGFLGSPLHMDVSGVPCVFGESVNFDGSIHPTVKDDRYCVVGEGTPTDTIMNLYGRVIVADLCEVYEFDDVAKGWQPPIFNQDLSMDINESITGQYLGGSVLARSAAVDISPVTFTVKADKLKWLNDLKNKLLKGMFFLSVDAPYGAKYIHLCVAVGSGLKAQYSNEYGFIDVTIDARAIL